MREMMPNWWCVVWAVSCRLTMLRSRLTEGGYGGPVARMDIRVARTGRYEGTDEGLLAAAKGFATHENIHRNRVSRGVVLLHGVAARSLFSQVVELRHSALSSTQNGVTLRRTDLPELYAASPNRASHREEPWVTVHGHGFLDTESLSCRFFSHDGAPVSGVITGSGGLRFVSSTQIRCRQPTFSKVLGHRVGVWGGMHWKGRGLRGGPRGGETGGWRRLLKRLGAVTVGYKCH